MTFLTLCQRVRSLADIAGTSASTPSTVVGQTGDLGRIVDWVNDAWEWLQNLYPDWKFMRSSFTIATTASDGTYVITDFTDSVSSSAMTVAGFSHWVRAPADKFRIYLTSAGVATERELFYLDYSDFRFLYLRGTQATGYPVYWTEQPRDRAVLLGPIPDASYTVTGDYMKGATRMTADADTPTVPAQFHMALVHKALMFYAAFEQDASLYGTAERDLNEVMSRLYLNQLPEVSIAEPMA